MPCCFYIASLIHFFIIENKQVFAFFIPIHCKWSCTLRHQLKTIKNFELVSLFYTYTLTISAASCDSRSGHAAEITWLMSLGYSFTNLGLEHRLQNLPYLSVPLLILPAIHRWNLKEFIRNKKRSLYQHMSGRSLITRDGIWIHNKEERKHYCITPLKYCCQFVIASSIIHKLARSCLNKQEVLLLSEGNAQCFSLLSVTVINTLSKDSLGRKGFAWLTSYCPSWEEAKAGIQGSRKRGGDIAYWLSSLCCSVTFVI